MGEGAVPMPIYTAINSRRDVSAQWFAGKLCFTGNTRYIYQYTSNHITLLRYYVTLLRYYVITLRYFCLIVLQNGLNLLPMRSVWTSMAHS